MTRQSHFSTASLVRPQNVQLRLNVKGLTGTRLASLTARPLGTLDALQGQLAGALAKVAGGVEHQGVTGHEATPSLGKRMCTLWAVIAVFVNHPVPCHKEVPSTVSNFNTASCTEFVAIQCPTHQCLIFGCWCVLAPGAHSEIRRSSRLVMLNA